MRGFRAILILICTLLMGGNALSDKQEVQVKAALLFNFAKYTQWPDDRFESKETPFRIGIVGQDPFGEILTATVLDRRLDGRRIEIIQARDEGMFDTCQILFIADSEAAKLKNVLSHIDPQRTLTVSDIEGFAASGGALEMFRYRGRIAFKANLRIIKRADYTIHAKVLSIARETID